MDYTEEEAELIAQYGTSTVLDGLLPDGMLRGPSRYHSEYRDHNVFLTHTDIVADVTGQHEDDENENMPALLADPMPLSAFVIKYLRIGLDHPIAFSSAMLNTARTIEKEHSTSNIINDDELEKEAAEYLAAADAELARKDYHYHPTGREGYANVILGKDYDETATPTESVPSVPVGMSYEEAAVYVAVGGGDRPRSRGINGDALDGDIILTLEEINLLEETVEARIQEQDNKRYAQQNSNTTVALFDAESTESIKERQNIAKELESIAARSVVATKARTEQYKRAASYVDVAKEVHKFLSSNDAALNNKNDSNSSNNNRVKSNNKLQIDEDKLVFPCRLDAAVMAKVMEVIQNEDVLAIPPNLHASEVSYQFVANTTAISQYQSTTCNVVDRLIPVPEISDVLLSNHDVTLTSGKTNSTEVKATSSNISSHCTDVQSDAIIVAMEQRQRKLKKRAEREEMLLALEAKERTLMRAAEEDTAKIQRKLDARGIINKREHITFYLVENSERQSLLSEQALVFADLLRREERQRCILLEWVTHKAAQLHVKAIGGVIAEEDLTRRSIAEEYDSEWSQITSQWRDQRVLLERFEENKMDILKAHEDQRNNNEFEEEKEWERLCLFHIHAESTEAVRLAEAHATARRKAREEFETAQRERRQEVLRQVEAPVNARLADCNATLLREKVQELHNTLQAAKKRKNNVIDPSSSPNVPTPPVKRGTKGVLLDGKLLQKLNPIHFLVAEGSLIGASAAFKNISCTLEGVTDIDYVSLSNVNVSTSIAAKNNINLMDNNNLRKSASMSRILGIDRHINVTAMVEHLTLSNNALSSLPAKHLLNVFPSLTSLTVSDNALNSLLLLETDNKSENNNSNKNNNGGSITYYDHLFQLDVSANKITSLIGLTQFPNLVQLVAYGNNIASISSAAIKTIPSYLMVLELSRNKISNLTGLEQIEFLCSLDCSRNSITDISPITNQTLLQYLYCSNNKIAELPRQAHWTFLRQLFIADNKISHLNALVHCPFLNVLSAESNEITDIEGIRGCPLLKRISLSFNKLQNLSSLLPLGYCIQLTHIVINDNPVTTARTPADITDITNDVVLPKSFNINEVALLPTYLVLGMCNKAKELNNDVVTEELSEKARIWLEQEVVCNNNPRSVNNIITPGMLEVLQQQQRFLSQRGEVLSLYEVLQREYDAVLMRYRKRYNKAVSVEQTLLKQLREGRINKITASLLRNSSAVFIEQQVGIALLLSRHLHLLKSGASASSIGTITEDIDDGSNNTAEFTARSMIADFIRSRILIKRARAELEMLKKTSKRYDKAATKIQAVWRGAIVRLRLRKAGLGDDDNDADFFHKVTFDEGSLDTVCRGGGAISLMLRNTVGTLGNVPMFDVSHINRVTSTPNPISGVMGHDGIQSILSIVRVSDAGRPLSQPQHKSGPSTQLSPQKPQTGRLSADQQQQQPLQDEWSVAMQNHLKKKNRKAQQQKQEKIRKEFLSDPLKARQIQQQQQQHLRNN